MVKPSIQSPTDTPSPNVYKIYKAIHLLLTKLFPDIPPPISKIAQISLWGGIFTPYLSNPPLEFSQTKVANADGYVPPRVY